MGADNGLAGKGGQLKQSADDGEEKEEICTLAPATQGNTAGADQSGAQKSQREGNTMGVKQTAGLGAAPEVLSWVACDKCEKWRRLTEGSLAQYQDKAFHCSYLPGFDCSTPEGDPLRV